MPARRDDLWPSRQEWRENDARTTGSATHPPEDAPEADGLIPPSPATVEDCGLDFSFLTNLALKSVYADTSCTTQRAAQKLALPF